MTMMMMISMIVLMLMMIWWKHNSNFQTDGTANHLTVAITIVMTMTIKNSNSGDDNNYGNNFDSFRQKISVMFNSTCFKQFFFFFL